jgi:homoserine dehydrogenase
LDVRFARELGYRIKLLAVIRREDGALDIRVHPALLPRDAMLASVNGVFNAVMVRGDLTGDTLYYGRGAGSDPTASTVIADIADIARNLSQGGPRHSRGVTRAGDAPRVRKPGEIRSRYYLRLMVKDEPGTLGAITTALGGRRVSIMAVTQRETSSQTVPVPVVALTHEALEADLDAALADIVASGILCEPPVRLRIVDE